MVEPSNQLWFHGRINRQEAEELLEKAGKRDGLYLLRESTAQTGSYALSMCHNRKIIHYHIQRHPDGTVAIEDGPRFNGPVELVNYHHQALDGLLTKLAVPCNRLSGVQPKKFSGVNQSNIQEAACAALASIGLVENEATATLMRNKIESAIGSVLHKNQPWFHGTISREEAERRINQLGCHEGLYLVRERKEPAGSFALGLAYQNSLVHYLFDVDDIGRLSIKAGPKFDNLMLAVDHYSLREDGLLCRLREPCDVEKFEGRKRTISQGSVSNGNQFEENLFLRNSGQAMVPDLIAGVINPFKPEPLSPPPGKSPSSMMPSKRFSAPPPLPAVGPPSRLSGPPPVPVRPAPSGFSLPMATKSHRILPPVPNIPSPHPGASGGGNFESIYDSIKMKKSSFYYNQFKDSPTRCLKKEHLTLDKELGHGNFGSVLQGEYRKGNGDVLAVAVKKLKSDEACNKSEIMHEADVMMKLDHPNIVRIIGMCQDGSMMLVMELAPEGPLHKYLKKNKSMLMLDVLVVMLQVAEGMQYLEKMQFVHRDLAARNVLVVNESFVKISDFGMSRAMGTGSDYYRAGKPGKWPLKWYAPECIYYRRFSSKSDVWSYGVTLWEATSYGTKPYQGLNGQVILEKIESGYRLPNPEGVPMEVHRIMKHCWEYREEERPTFTRIAEALYDIIVNIREK